MLDQARRILRLLLTACLMASSVQPLPALDEEAPPDPDPIIIIEEEAFLQSISITDPSSLTLEIGQAIDLNATGTFSDGSTQSVNPAWSAGCGTIDAVTGLYSATEPGSCSVTASIQNFTDTLTFVVVSPPPVLQSVSISGPTNSTLTFGDSFDFDATGSYSDGSAQPVNPTWSATCGEINPATGEYSATGLGPCTISGSLDDQTASLVLTIEVPPPTLQTIDIIEPPSLAFDAGETFDFDAVGSYSDGSAVNVSPVWSATCGVIDPATGNYIATDAGTCSVSATLDGRNDSVFITVRTPAAGVVMERARVIFNFDKNGPFEPQLRKFLDWAGISYNAQTLSATLKDFGKNSKAKKKGSEEPAPQVVDLLPLVNADWQGGIEEFRLLLTGPDGESKAELRLIYEQPVMRASDGSKVQLPAKVSFNPTNVDIDSKREFITARIELPAGYSAERISRITVGITEIDGEFISDPPLRSSPQSFALEDSDGNGTTELMLKFRFSRLKRHLPQQGSSHFTVTGYLNTGEEFSTEYDQIVVRSKGQKTVLDEKGKAHVRIGDGDCPDDLDVTVKPEDDSDSGRNDAASQKGLKPAGQGYSFGPEGTLFQKPVEITLPYDPRGLSPEQEARLRICYWNPARRDWEELDSSVDRDNSTVRAFVNHFSLYQVLAPQVITQTTAIDPGFSLGAVFAFPNPATGVRPTFHMEAGLADELLLHIYDVAGELKHEAVLTGAPALVNGAYAYEYPWPTADLAPGLYVFTVRAKRAGFGDLTARGKVAVLK